MIKCSTTGTTEYGTAAHSQTQSPYPWYRIMPKQRIRDIKQPHRYRSAHTGSPLHTLSAAPAGLGASVPPAGAFGFLNWASPFTGIGLDFIIMPSIVFTEVLRVRCRLNTKTSTTTTAATTAVTPTPVPTPTPTEKVASAAAKTTETDGVAVTVADIVALGVMERVGEGLGVEEADGVTDTVALAVHDCVAVAVVEPRAVRVTVAVCEALSEDVRDEVIVAEADVVDVTLPDGV